jgi:Ca-activated chloride channel family protein
MKIVFDNPQFLWYLISVPVLVLSHFLFLKYTKRKAIRFANFEALKRVSGERLITKNLTILVLRSLTLTILILAVAGPVYWYKGLSNDNDFVLALDTSASMTAKDLKPTRLEAAKQAAEAFVNSLSSRTNLGLVTFSSQSELGMS